MPKDDEATVKVPWNVIIPLLAGLLGGGAATGATSFTRNDEADLNALRVQIVEMRADVKAIGVALQEVKSIEEAAHPRAGVPGGPFPATPVP